MTDISIDELDERLSEGFRAHLAQHRRELSDDVRRSIADAMGRRDLGDRAVLDGWPLGSVERRILDAMRDDAAPWPGDIDMPQSDVRRWSLFRWMDAVRHDPQAAMRTLEGEASAAVAKSLDREGAIDLKRIFVPRQIIQRDLTASSPGGGGFLTDAPIGGFSDALHQAAVLRRLGAMFLGPFSGSPGIPGFLSTATATWLTGEGAAAAQSEQVFDSLFLNPHTVAVYGKISRKLSKQGTPQAEQLILNDFARLLSVAVDVSAIGGDGSAGTLLGLVNQDGVGTFTGSSLDYAALVSAMLDVATANAIVNPASLGFATTPTVASLLKQRYRAAATESDAPLWVGSLHDGTIEGERAIASNSIPASTMIYGDWSQLIVGEWGVLELEADPFTDFRSGLIGLRAIWSVDMAVRHAASFTIASSIS